MRFAKKSLFKIYGIICISQQRVRPYLVFVTTQASLLVKKANDVLEMNVGGSKLYTFL